MMGAASGRRPARLRHTIGGIWADALALRPRPAVKALVRGYAKNDILTYASAISFQVFFALIPLALFALGVLGFLHLEEVWRADIAPEVRASTSKPAFAVIDDTVDGILGRRQLFWITLGAAITVWEISGAMRAVMGVFNSIYGVEEQRPVVRRFLVSCALAAVVGILLLAAVVVARFGGSAMAALLGEGPTVAGIAFVLRWSVVIALLLLAVGLLVRFAPATRRPVRWAGYGAVLVVLGWVAMSLIFGWYVSSVANYGSIFGGLATLIVTMEYLYLSSIVFLTGIQIDALTRRSVEGPGERPGERLGP
jgi:membrane protein